MVVPEGLKNRIVEMHIAFCASETIHIIHLVTAASHFVHFYHTPNSLSIQVESATMCVHHAESSVWTCIASLCEWRTLTTPCPDDMYPFPIDLAAHHLISNSLVVLAPSTIAINTSCYNRDRDCICICVCLCTCSI